eukprot:scaffold708_cov70-Phaeocystis_antarctica.AAC.5
MTGVLTRGGTSASKGRSTVSSLACFKRRSSIARSRTPPAAIVAGCTVSSPPPAAAPPPATSPGIKSGGSSSTSALTCGLIEGEQGAEEAAERLARASGPAITDFLDMRPPPLRPQLPARRPPGPPAVRLPSSPLAPPPCRRDAVIASHGALSLLRAWRLYNRHPAAPPEPRRATRPRATRSGAGACGIALAHTHRAVPAGRRASVRRAATLPCRAPPRLTRVAVFYRAGRRRGPIPRAAEVGAR